MRKSFLIWTIALAMVVIPTAAIGQEGSVQYVHDPSIIKQADTFYVFSTGHGIPIRRSTNLYDWENIGSVFKKMPDWMPKLVPGVKFPWAPDISFFNGRYHLYYSVSTFGSNKSAIGLATNKTLDPQDKDYKWVDQGPVLQSQPDSDDWNAIDPNVILDEKGQLWMSFGSFWGGIKLCRLNLETGKRADEKLFSIASRPVAKAIEAPFIIHMKGFYYLFVSFDFCCRGADSTYKIMVGRSKKITGPYYDRAGWPLMKGGGTLLLAGYGNYRGPGHNAILIDG
ncbi:MAG: arabinan endo-1,5-alpha-L-arabinosidase, partial [Nitrospirae bacterium]|nr:arabinan endo-1,5-alpha-L-arabinosidase [Nitrospirota bacterium]